MSPHLDPFPIRDLSKLDDKKVQAIMDDLVSTKDTKAIMKKYNIEHTAMNNFLAGMHAEVHRTAKIIKDAFLHQV